MVTAILVLGLAGACSRPHAQSSAEDQRVVAAARAFETRYVDSDGRVVRRDQGGDTVSEGVGYALLIAVALHDRPTFDRVRDWADAHLAQPDGLLASHWVDGAVVDAHSAADADVQVAWALARAGRLWGSRYTAAATTLARAIADHEIGYDDGGRPVLAAGDWALGAPGRPVIAEPGYWTVPATVALARLTSDRRWAGLRDSQAALVAALTDRGASLPSDWISVGAGTSITAIPDPTTGTPPQSGPDGLRAIVWSALDPANRPVLERWSPLIEPQATASPLALHLDGTVANPAQAPLAAVAAAAAARARGDVAGTAQHLEAADAVAARYPTYYGQAWDALGRILLTTNRLEEAA